MLSSKRIISEGDLVVMYSTPENLTLIKVQEEKIFSNKYGEFPHSRLIDVEYGSKIIAQRKGGWVYALPLTAELWTSCLTHRTQILYTLDISTIIFNLEIKPGSIVVESGTGSGSLSTSIARAIAPTGHLFTFEFNDVRAQSARDDFKNNGIGDIVTVTHRNVCDIGFMIDGKLTEKMADAVFLDLPSPWDCITHSDRILKFGGMLCSFSPCIEQVQKCSMAMDQNGFVDISTIECLLKPITIDKEKLIHFTPTLKENPQKSTEQQTQDKNGKEKIKIEEGEGEDDDIVIVGNNNDDDEQTTEEDRSTQIHITPTVEGNPKKKSDEKHKKSKGKGKEKVKDKKQEESDDDDDDDEQKTEHRHKHKHKRGTRKGKQIETENENGEKSETNNNNTDHQKRKRENDTDNETIITTRFRKEIRGHTGYLTFARKVVVIK